MKVLKTIDSVFNKIESVIDSALNKIEGAVLIFLLLVMLFMAFGQVVLRNFFSGGIVWGDILLRHLVLWIGFLGAALATSGERHITIDILTRYLSERFKGVVATVSNVFAAVICFLLFRASLTFIDFEIANKNTTFAGLPSWYVQIIIPVGYGLLLIHFLIRAVHVGKAAVYLPNRFAEIVSILINIFAFCVCYFLSRASIASINFGIVDNNTMYAGILSWMALIIILLGYGLVMAHFLIRAILDAGKALQKGAAV